jgi:hypothetical protein
MSTENKTKLSEEDFRKVLNSQGFGFQYAVLAEIQKLIDEHWYENIYPKWKVEEIEVPVSVNGNATQIDFILSKQGNSDYRGNVALIAECKRADPALANWCFLRAPFSSNEYFNDSFRLEKVSFAERHFDVYFNVVPFQNFKDESIQKPFYEIPFSFRTGEIGNGDGKSRKEFNEAVGQVLRGSSGYVTF